MNQLGLKVGILGGGQLARMLSLSGSNIGLNVHILSEKSSDPATQVTKFCTEGHPEKSHDLELFSENLELITFESEFYKAASLETAMKKSKAYLFPSTSCMALIQDRASQKNLLDEYKIPTAPFVVVKSNEDLQSSFNLFKKMVLKKRFGGYDGTGTWLIKSTLDLKKFDTDLVHTPGLISEKLIPFKRELAVMLVRSRTGEKLALPLVQSQQKDSRCDTVWGPLTHKSWPQMKKQFFKMMDDIDYVGVLGVELFDTGHTLLVNELAPRVHNSGHYTMNALNFSQFDLHWMAGLGMKLPEIKLSCKNFVMINLIGKKKSMNMKFPPNISGHIHWYGKEESRPGRKMGHINYTGNSAKELLKKSLQERSKFIL